MKKRYEFIEEIKSNHHFIKEGSTPTGTTAFKRNVFEIECVEEKVIIEPPNRIFLSEIPKDLQNVWYRQFLNRRIYCKKNWTTFLLEQYNVLNDGKSVGLAVYTIG